MGTGSEISKRYSRINVDMDMLSNSVTQYFTTLSNIDLSDCKISDINPGRFQSFVHLKPLHPGIPSLIQVDHDESFNTKNFIPYYGVNERPDRQIMSYVIGAGLANLAEITEINAKLFSRACFSYTPGELIHVDPVQSCIGLWVHDCLTEDLDHHTTLNRKFLPGGICISFDFGLAFSSRYYPPFYTAELGLEDEYIEKHQPFLLELLADYAKRLKSNEQSVMTAVKEKYAKTHHVSLCQYYLKNFLSLFPVRLRYGRFFDKIKNTPFDPKDIEQIAEAIGLNTRGIIDWKGFIGKLTGIKPAPMDLRGLDLSGVDIRNAYFKESDLRGANLSGSNVDGADFRSADLRGACMEGLNMEKAMTEGTIFK